MSRQNLAWLLGIVALNLLSLGVFLRMPARQENEDYKMVRLVVDVLHEVRKNYVTEIDQERERRLVEDMVNGGLERLDPHSTYINPKELKAFNKTSTGKFGGIGVQVGYDRQHSGYLQVVSPMVNTPAYKAGILAGDLILKVDGKSAENLKIGDAVDMIQGEPGTKITLTVLHEGQKEPVDITVERAIIDIPAVMGDRRKKDKPEEYDFFLDKETYGVDRVGYIRLVGFSDKATAEMKSALRELEKGGARAVIIDMHGNPGGLLKAAVEIADLFLTEGRIVSTRGRNQQEEVYEAEAPGTMFLPAEKYPVVVLVNKYSASASEILAAALQDHNRAVVVGERSYGKGSVQNIIPMEEKTSALKLTTASYWRPNGKNIHRFPDSKDTDDWGVRPNPGFEVPLKDEERLEWMIWRNERDVVRNGPRPESKPEAKPEDKDKEKKPFRDRVLDKAVEHLKEQLDKIQRAEKGDA